MKKTVLQIENFKKIYKNGRGVNNITLKLQEGDVVGMLGPNGSGKTTTMKAVVGLSRADSGDINIFGHDIDTDFEAAIQDVGCLIETPALYDSISAYKNLKLASRYYKKFNKESAEKRIMEVLELVSLEKYAKDKVGKFSLGMRQRLGIALALLSNPKLVLLDEPTNGLDIEGVIHVRNIIAEMSEKLGATFLIAGHVASELEKMCNKVAVIYDGELKAFDTVDNILENYPSLEEYFLSVIDNSEERIKKIIGIDDMNGGENNVRNIG